MYESNYFHILIAEDRSEGIEVTGRPAVQGAKRCKEDRKGLYVCWEAAEGPFLEISGDYFVKAKANYEMIGVGKGIVGRHKVGGFLQRGEFSIDEGDEIAREGACVGGHWDFA